MELLERKLGSACCSSKIFPKATYTVMKKGKDVQVSAADYHTDALVDKGYEIVAVYQNGEEVER